MLLSDWINVVLCILSFLLVVISIWVSIRTLKQNEKMIENATRPYIMVVYETMILPHDLKRYVVVKNYGQTAAKILHMTCTGIQNEFFLEQLRKCVGATLAPSQRLFYYYGGPNLGDVEMPIFDYQYTANGKIYSEKVQLQLITGANTSRAKGEDAVSFALQEISERLI